MRTYHFRFIASFCLAIFLASICVVLVAWACQDLKSKVGTYDTLIESQKDKIKGIEANGYLGSMAENGWYGMGVGVAVGTATAASTGPLAPVTAIPVIAKGALIGSVGGVAWGGINHHKELSAANDELERLQGLRAEAQADYEECLNPTAKYTYTDEHDYVWEFSAEVYGSDEAAYDAYMNFIASQGH